jgi:hypothetical protein
MGGGGGGVGICELLYYLQAPAALQIVPQTSSPHRKPHERPTSGLILHTEVLSPYLRHIGTIGVVAPRHHDRARAFATPCSFPSKMYLPRPCIANTAISIGARARRVGR